MYDYIDDDRGSGYHTTDGLADGWQSNADIYLGVALLLPSESGDQQLHNGWIKAVIDIK